MIGATPSEGKVSPAGEGKAYLQPDNITEVTAKSLVASTCASTRAAVLKAANQAIQDSHLWSFSRDGKFSGPDCDGTLKSFPPRLAKACYSYSHYFNKPKDGSDKASIHDMCQRSFPGIFDLSNASSFNWRTAPRSNIHKFALDLFSSLAPAWLKGIDALCAQRCLFSLSKTRPDKFETFYTNGNLNSSTEGAFWLAANQVLGSRWHMKAPLALKMGNHKGIRRVNFHYAPGAKVLSYQAGTFLRQPGTRSGDCQEAIGVTTAVHRSHHTYVTISLPRCAPPSNEVFD